MKRLVMHVGTQKTGTTSLQVFLEENAAQLAEQGFFVPGTKMKYKEAITARNAHFLVWHARELNVPETVSEDVRQMTTCNIEAFKDWVAGHDTVLLSDETLWYEGARRPSTWKIAKEVLVDAGFDEIDIVVYLRRQDDYICSLWNQRVKGSLQSTVSCPEFVSGNTSRKLMDYSAVLSELEEVFGKEHITVREYRRDKLEGGDVRVDFCSIVGVDATSGFTFADVRPNLGLTSNVAEIKREANQSETYRRGPNFLRAAAQNVSMLQQSRDTTSLLPPHMRLEILQRYAAGNERIAREYLGREDGVLFDQPDDLPDEWMLDNETFARDAIRFFADALSAEHAKRLASDRRVKDLAARVKALERRAKALEKQSRALDRALDKALGKQAKALEKQGRAFDKRIAGLEKRSSMLKARVDRLALGEGLMPRVRRKLRKGYRKAKQHVKRQRQLRRASNDREARDE